MKILQISDTHIVGEGEEIYGIDPYQRLETCVADIGSRHRDADLAIVTGDLTDRAQPEAYRRLRECLAGLPMPYYLMIGNHDNRAVFQASFPEAPLDESGYVQAALQTPAGRLLLLDTVEDGAHWGRYCDARAGWLDQQLREAAQDSVYLFMHHPPVGTYIPSLDSIGLKEPANFERVVRSHSNIKHIFFGHVHRPMSGSWKGIPFSALKSIVHQVRFDLETETPVPKSLEPPCYAVIWLHPEHTVVHLHDYLDRSALPIAKPPQ